jgi:hypothetical protein
MTYAQSMPRDNAHGAIRPDQAPGPANPTPVAPAPNTNKSAWGTRSDSGVRGETLDKTLRHLDRRATENKAPPRLYIGPIVEGPVKIPWGERR